MPKSKPITGPSPSEFNARITLERPAKVPDGGGGFTSTFVALPNQGDPDNPSIAAKVNMFQSDETVIGMQFSALQVGKVEIRYRTDLKSDCRVKFQGKYYNMVGNPIDVGNRHRILFFRMKG